MHIVVTGANRGIGLEFCKQMADLGHAVTALCRTASPEVLALEVTVIEGVDVRRPPELKELETIDWLVLNAGIWREESLSDLNFETISEQLEVNTFGPMRMVLQLQEQLSPTAKIGLMTSLMGSMADNRSGGRYGYRMSKAALNCFGVSLAHDLKSRGIAVVLLHPGYVATDMTDHRGTISAQESVKGLISVMNDLTLESTGTFRDYRGRLLPW